MQLTCPQCNMPLPEVETLEYRFCPGCGAEIPAKSETLDEAFQTIPPDLSAQRTQQKSNASDSETGPNVKFVEKLNDKTSAPQSMAKSRRPELKPPNTPPPTSFHRIRSVETFQSTRSEGKAPPEQIIQKRPSAKYRNIIIAGLIVLALIILLLGGLFTF